MSSASVRRVLHPVLVTRDFTRALTFYGDLLGLLAGPVHVHDAEYLRRLGGPAAAIAKAVIMRAPDGSEIEIAAFEQPGGRADTDAGWADAGIRSITFVVADLVAMATKMAKHDYPMMGQVLPTAEDGGRGRVAYVRGPDGVIVTLLQKADDISC